MADDSPCLPRGEGDVELTGYSQHRCNYTKTMLSRWFKFRPEIVQQLAHLTPKPLSHRRVGDYRDNCYPIISASSYATAWAKYSYEPMEIVTEETAMLVPGLPNFLPDFYRMSISPVLFRGNSSFSWWAGALSNGKVYSPQVVGLQYGIEHDNVPFVEGNWSRIADLHMVGELCLRSE